MAELGRSWPRRAVVAALFDDFAHWRAVSKELGASQPTTQQQPNNNPTKKLSCVGADNFGASLTKHRQSSYVYTRKKQQQKIKKRNFCIFVCFVCCWIDVTRNLLEQPNNQMLIFQDDDDDDDEICIYFNDFTSRDFVDYIQLIWIQFEFISGLYFLNFPPFFYLEYFLNIFHILVSVKSIRFVSPPSILIVPLKKNNIRMYIRWNLHSKIISKLSRHMIIIDITAGWI